MDVVIVSAWKNFVNAVIGNVGMFLSPRALKSRNSIEKIKPRMLCASFNGNPCTITISCNNPTDASDEMDIINFYNELSFLVQLIPKHNVPIICGDMNAQIDKDENNNFCLHRSSNRNGEYLTDFPLENRLACLNTKLYKREGKLWTDTYPNNAKPQLDYIPISKKWVNSARNS